MWKRSQRFIISAIAGLFLAWMPRMSLAAEKVIFSYQPFEFSITITDLDTFANTGKVEGSLKPFFKSISPEQQAELRTLLATQLNIDVTATSQLLYSSLGEGILRHMGNHVQDSQRQNSFYALRSAMIQSAREKQGISPVSILKYFPTETLYLNSTTLKLTLKELKQRSQLKQTLMNTLNQDMAPVSAKAYKPILAPGDRSQVQRFSLNLPTTNIHRSVRGELFLPKTTQSNPLIIISPGFGDDRTAFKSLRDHLLSQEFAVVIVEHPGSDQEHFQHLLQGRIQEVIHSEEWIHRPQDISHLIDWLESDLAPLPLRQQLDLEKIAVLGYSLGGNTVLNLAGARSNSGQLKDACQALQQKTHGLDLAPLMLCPTHVSETQEIPSLADSRVKAIVAMNPFGNHVFSPQGLQAIKIPSLLIAGAEDRVAPLLTESICPFREMSQPHQSLVVIEDGQHYFGNDTDEEGLFSFSPKLRQPDPALMSHYLNTMILSFVGEHLHSDRHSDRLFTVNELQKLSSSQHSLHLVNGETQASQQTVIQEICSELIGP